MSHSSARVRTASPLESQAPGSATGTGPVRSDLKRALRDAGLLAPRPLATYLKAAILLTLAGAAHYGVAFSPEPWLRVPLFLMTVALTIALVMVGHESGHGTISRHRLVNDLLGYLTFPLIAGVSFSFWRHKHNQHHANVNVDGHDPDVPIFPLAMTPRERVNRSGPARMMQQFQMQVFWPLTLLTGFAFRVDGLRFVLGPGRRLGSATERWLDRACLALHLPLWLGLPSLAFDLPLLTVTLFYLAWTLGAGLLLALIFLPAHTPFALFNEARDNVRLQLETSQNLLTNRLFSWLLIGLDHQVEHHLFPRMSHLNVRRAAPIVRAHCARAGLPYKEQGWGAALWASTLEVGARREREPVDQQPVVSAVPARESA